MSVIGPQEVLLRVFSYLGPKDLLSCSNVSRQWRQVASDNTLWNKLYPGLDTRFSIMGLVKPRIVTNETELLDRI